MAYKEENHLYRLEKCENNSFKIIKYNTEVICDSNDNNLYYAHYPGDNEIVSEELLKYDDKTRLLGDIYDVTFTKSVLLTIDDGVPVFLIGSCNKDHCLLFDTSYNNEYLYGHFPIKRLGIVVVVIVVMFVVFSLFVKYFLLY